VGVAGFCYNEILRYFSTDANKNLEILISDKTQIGSLRGRSSGNRGVRKDFGELNEAAKSFAPYAMQW
jgi:hypothetical protein